MVTISRLKNAVTAPPIMIESTMPGQFGRNFFKLVMNMIVATQKMIESRLYVPILFQITGSFSKIGPGSFSLSSSPSILISWLETIITAIPAVNPTVTG